jgi:glycogen operon protein
MTQLAAGKPAPWRSYDGKGVNFTLFSAHAERVELCVFDEQGANNARPAAAAISGTAGWPTPGPACATAIACMARGNRAGPPL